ncbi:MAG: SBBP repeat-containing protein [Bryobacterales bacterium]|nr:SBBP repeat-containing protein [Bryobacterales bacterium]
MIRWLCLVLLTAPVLAPGAAPLPSFFTPAGDALMIRTPGLSACLRPDRVEVDTAGQPLTIRWVGASPARLEPLDASGAHASFFQGSGQWHERIPLYARAAYRGIYPGVDLIYAVEGRRLKSEYHLAAGVDPRQIRVVYEGATGVRVDPDGALQVSAAEGIYREEAPVLYQPHGSGRLAVTGGFDVHDDGSVGFSVESWDPSLPLVIDPPLAYSTYLGGSLTDRIQALATDSAGNVYAAGFTASFNFPATAGSAQGSWAGSVDAFVAKLSPGGSLLWVTHLGGSGDDRGQSVAVDAGGSVYVTGWTQSSNFPTVSAHRAFLLGSRDAFVAKLNPLGSALVYSTYYGGTGSDAGHAIAVDSSSHAYVTGVTGSTNFPLVNPLQSVFGGVQDAFVAKFSPAGNTLVYSTYLGGSGEERGTGIAVHEGEAVVYGTTRSANFPTASAYQNNLSGTQDVFLTRLNTGGSALVFSTLFGGPGVESAEAGGSVSTDAPGNVYIAGITTGTIPVLNAAQPNRPGGSSDGFAAKFQPGGGLAFSTYLGGSAADLATAVAVDPSGRVYLTGYTNSSNFPVVNASQSARGGDYDAFLTRLSATGSVIEESTFIGGNAVDAGYGVAVDGSGRVYAAGLTHSANFPTQNAAQPAFGGTIDAFLAGFAPETASVSPASGGGSQQTFAVGYTNTLGLSDTQSVTFLVHTTAAALTSSCAVQYEVGTGSLRLRNDAGTAWLGPVSPGSPAVLENQQCHLAASGSSVVTSGDSITVHLALTFKPLFWGAKTLFIQSDRYSSGGVRLGPVRLLDRQRSAVGYGPSAGLRQWASDEASRHARSPFRSRQPASRHGPHQQRGQHTEILLHPLRTEYEHGASAQRFCPGVGWFGHCRDQCHPREQPVHPRCRSDHRCRERHVRRPRTGVDLQAGFRRNPQRLPGDVDHRWLLVRHGADRFLERGVAASRDTGSPRRRDGLRADIHPDSPRGGGARESSGDHDVLSDNRLSRQRLLPPL